MRLSVTLEEVGRAVALHATDARALVSSGLELRRGSSASSGCPGTHLGSRFFLSRVHQAETACGFWSVSRWHRGITPKTKRLSKAVLN